MENTVLNKLAELSAVWLCSYIVSSCVQENSEVWFYSSVLVLCFCIETFKKFRKNKNKDKEEQKNEAKNSETVQTVNNIEIQNTVVNNNSALPIIATGVVIAILILGTSRRSK